MDGNDKYEVRLKPTERKRLERRTHYGQAKAKEIQHAQILLMADTRQRGGEWTDQAIAETLSIHINTVARTRKRFALQGEQAAVQRKHQQRPPRPAVIDGQAEAQLVAVCCSSAPDGQVRWTLRLLASELMRRKIVTHVCAETVRKTLKKTNCSLGVNSAGVSPSKMRLGL